MTPEELLKEVGEPVGLVTFVDGECYAELSDTAKLVEFDELFASDQVAAAILKVTKPLEDSLAVVKQDRADLYMETLTLRDQLAKAEQLWQVAQGRCDGLEEKLAKAEQRVAEACALQVATETKFHWLDAARVAKEIRSGEWRKFVKEV